jgi:hypothetical protein
MRDTLRSIEITPDFMKTASNLEKPPRRQFFRLGSCFFKVGGSFSSSEAVFSASEAKKSISGGEMCLN